MALKDGQRQMRITVRNITFTMFRPTVNEGDLLAMQSDLLVHATASNDATDPTSQWISARPPDHLVVSRLLRRAVDGDSDARRAVTAWLAPGLELYFCRYLGLTDNAVLVTRCMERLLATPLTTATLPSLLRLIAQDEARFVVHEVLAGVHQATTP